MNEQGYLTADQAADAQANPAELSEAAAARAGGYFADWVMSSGPEFFTRQTTEDVIIRTTLDQRIQRAAEEGLRWIFENKVREGSNAQAAIVVMDADGAVRAMVGAARTRWPVPLTAPRRHCARPVRPSNHSFMPLRWTWDIRRLIPSRMHL